MDSSDPCARTSPSSPPPGPECGSGAPVQREACIREPACTGPPEVPCPHVEDTAARPDPGPPCRTSQKLGLRGQPAHHMAKDGVLRRMKYETLPDHLSDLAVSEILSSDRFKSTASESFTFKRRDRCLNPEPLYSPAPPSGSVEYLGEVEERLRRSSLPASRPRFSEYSEAYAPRRRSCADALGNVAPAPRRPPTDVLPRHIYTAKTGVAGEVNPYLSTTAKDFGPVSAEAARRYRDKPSNDTFTGDPVIPAEAVPQPRWHGFTPVVPNRGLCSEVQRRYQRPKPEPPQRPVAPPLHVPPTTRQLLGESAFECESQQWGTGRYNPVTLSCGGLLTKQHHRRKLCGLQLGDTTGNPSPCAGPFISTGSEDVGISGPRASPRKFIRDNHYGLQADRTPCVSQLRAS